jgi:SAM-dependent methyltransferase
MYQNLLGSLACPVCGDASLLLVVGGQHEDEIVSGGVRCEHCGHVAPIADGILDVIEGAPVPWTPAQLTNYAPPAAWGYERLWRGHALSLLSGERFPVSRELSLVCELLEPQREGLMLDVACSNGLYARAFAAAAPTAVIAGVDHSRAMLLEARRVARSTGQRISFVRASAQALPFRAGSVAGYGMGGSLNEIGDIDRMLTEARRVLQSDGNLVTMHLLQASSPWGRLLQAILAHGGIVFPSPAELNARFARAGLQLASSWRWRVVAINLLRARPAV